MNLRIGQKCKMETASWKATSLERSTQRRHEAQNEFSRCCDNRKSKFSNKRLS